MIQQRTENIILKRYLHTHVHCSIIHNSQEVEATQKSVKEWMDKVNMYLECLGQDGEVERHWAHLHSWVDNYLQNNIYEKDQKIPENIFYN